MTVKNLQNDIISKEGYILSDGTLNLVHLLPKAYDLIVAYELKTALKDEIEGVFVNTDESEDKLSPLFRNQYYSLIKIPEKEMEEANNIWDEGIYNFFNSIAPEGYYFGNTEDDGACIGWFKCEEEEENNGE